MVPDGDVLLQAPPGLPGPDGGNTWLTALPALSGLGSVAYMFAGPANPITYVAGSMFLFSSLAMVGGSVIRGRSTTKGSADQGRKDFLRYLERARRQVRSTASAQREAAGWSGPEPAQLWALVSSPRLWERRPADDVFGVLRVGLGPQRLATPLVPAESGPLDELDPLCATALKRFVTTHSTVPELPVALSLRRFAAVRLSGDIGDRRSLARAVIAQATAFHAPTDLRIVACVREPEDPVWSWLKWLPHSHDPETADHVGPVRMVRTSLPAVEEMLGADLARRARFNRSGEPDSGVPHLIVLIDGGRAEGAELLLDADGLQGVTVLDLDGMADDLVRAHGIELVTDDGRLAVRVGDRLERLGTTDALSVPAAEALARQVGGVRLDSVTARAEGLASADPTLPGLLGMPDPCSLDIGRLWKPRPVRDRLRVPLGISADGTVMELDLKEAAEDGMGPHGLVVGATGSGKSELLRTLVLALASTHSSETLNLVLVDFKGGATFAGMSGLPHVAAVITNLRDELSLVDRMREALSGEMNRRQEILRAAGNLVSVRDYERARVRGAALEPLPSLVVVVDEFSELLSQKPEFADLFVQIGRLGRSLGLHLLLASQRLEEGRLRGLESHLSYRVGLRTFSAQESRSVLGVSDAYELPSSPGHGYLKTDISTMKRFKAAYVSGAHLRAGDLLNVDGLGVAAEVRQFTVGYQEGPGGAVAQAPRDAAADAAESDVDVPARESVMSVMVSQLAELGPPAHQVWLPPLDEPETVDRLYGGLAARTGRGFGADPELPVMSAPIGVVDRPFHQRRDPLVVDLAGAGGNVGVVGGPRSGKSTLLRTLIASLALRHTPAEVQFYALDFSGGTLFSLVDLPHVGAVAGRQDGDVVRRIVSEVSRIVARRERRFRELGVDTMAAYRSLKAAGDAGDDPYGDVFLLVDGIGVLRQEFEDVEAEVVALAGRALTYGVHIVATAYRWLEFRLGVRDLFGTKLELKLGDPMDSEVDRRAAATVPGDRPGRGITSDRMHYLAAIPRIDGRGRVDDLGMGVSELVRRVSSEWTGPAAPRVRLLPKVVEYSELPQGARERGIAIGIEGQRLEPVVLRPGVDPGALLLGDAESGKTSFLRVVARQVLERWTPAEAKIVVVDYRRTMLGEFDGDGLLGYAAGAAQAADVVAGLVDGFTRRLPGHDVTPEQLRTRSWWHGPEIFVLVDDYDLISPAANPLLPLVEFLSQARDIGLHLYVARRAGGANRSLLDPVLGRARELGFPGVVLSAPRDEGSILGVRPSVLPPGRGTLVHRRYGTVPIQLARLDPAQP